MGVRGRGGTAREGAPTRVQGKFTNNTSTTVAPQSTDADSYVLAPALPVPLNKRQTALFWYLYNIGGYELGPL